MKLRGECHTLAGLLPENSHSTDYGEGWYRVVWRR